MNFNFDALTMKEEESIQAFFSSLFHCHKWNRSYGDTIKDKKTIQKILRTLPSKFDYKVVTKEISKDSSKFSSEELMKTLITCKERMQNLNEPLEQAFQ